MTFTDIDRLPASKIAVIDAEREAIETEERAALLSELDDLYCIDICLPWAKDGDMDKSEMLVTCIRLQRDAVRAEYTELVNELDECLWELFEML